MLEASARHILERLPESDLLLDVGGWASPFGRADWVLDLLPYETRGLYGRRGGPERFRASTWVQRDICDHEPWPFADDEFDFALCSQTLEDVRDPVWVCRELCRVARAGYIEVPSRLEEQSYGVHGPWVGWSHHRWLCDVAPGAIEFAFKPHVVHARASDQFPAEFYATLEPEQRVSQLWWERGFAFGERIFTDTAELDRYLSEFVARQRLAAPAPQVPTRRARLAGRLKRA